MLFQMVCSIFKSQSGSSKYFVLKCNTESKTEHTIWERIANWAEKRRKIVCGVLFDLSYYMTSSVLDSIYKY